MAVDGNMCALVFIAPTVRSWQSRQTLIYVWSNTDVFLYLLHYFKQSYEDEQYFRKSGLLLTIHSRTDLAKLYT